MGNLAQSSQAAALLVNYLLNKSFMANQWQSIVYVQIQHHYVFSYISEFKTKPFMQKSEFNKSLQITLTPALIKIKKTFSYYVFGFCCTLRSITILYQQFHPMFLVILCSVIKEIIQYLLLNRTFACQKRKPIPPPPQSTLSLFSTFKSLLWLASLSV